MGSKAAWRRLNWISYLSIVCLMKQTMGASREVTSQAGFNFSKLFSSYLWSTVVQAGWCNLSAD